MWKEVGTKLELCLSFQCSFNNKCMECFKEESMTLYVVVVYKNHDILGCYSMLRSSWRRKVMEMIFRYAYINVERCVMHKPIVSLFI